MRLDRGQPIIIASTERGDFAISAADAASRRKVEARSGIEPLYAALQAAA
jgi:hypothetical protein